MRISEKMSNRIISKQDLRSDSSGEGRNKITFIEKG